MSLAPDGRRVAVTRHPPGADDEIVVFDLERGTSSRLVAGGNSRFPVSSPDGRKIAFASTRAGSWDLYQVSLDDAATVEPLWIQAGDQIPSSWSPDAQSLVFISNLKRGLSVLPLGGEPTKRPTSSVEAPAISPDGRWLAYAVRPDVLVEPFSSSGRPEIVSPDGGSQPVWSRDGHRLFYEHEDALFAVAIGSGPNLEIGEPELIASVRLLDDPGGFPSYAVSDEGRIVMLEQLSENDAPHTRVVIHWFEELKARVPTNE